MSEYYIIYAWSDCPYCVQVKEVLIKNKKQFMFCTLDESPHLLEMLKEKHNWQTVPMVIHYKKVSKAGWKPEFIGGCSDLCKAFG